MSAEGLVPATDIDDAVEEAMEKIRESHFLTDAVGRLDSIDFLNRLISRIEDLTGELGTEIMKHGG